MEALKICLCCLLPADKDHKTPYSQRGAQMYTDMLEDCFQIHLTLGGDGECGICYVCVGRLRDANDFKLQVQRCQVELQARLQGVLDVKDELDEELVDEREIPCEDYGDIGDLLQRDPLVKEEIDDVMVNENLKTGSVALDPTPMSSCGHLYNRRFLIDHNYAKTDDHSVQSETDIELPFSTCDGQRQTSPIIPAPSASPVSARAKEQLAATCSVRLERLRGDEARASQTCLATPLLSSVLSNGESSNADSESEDNNSPFKCQERQKTIDVEDGVIKGNIAIETITLFSRDPSEAESVISESEDDNSPLKCHECQETFILEDSLTEHMAVHAKGSVASETKALCNEEGETYDAESGPSESEHDNSPFKCHECQETFILEDSLTEHMAVHAKGSVATETKALCNEEGETYDAESGPSESEHDNSPFKCHECQETFILEDSLTEHMAVHAKGIVATETKALCNEEGETYDAESGPSESEHDNSPFKCQECQKTFDLEDSLISHMAAHTNGSVASKPKTHVCKHCHIFFELKADFIKHMENHVDLRCGFCKKVLANRGSLRSHMRIHTGEKPFSCELCNKKFGHKHNLKNHKKLHNEGILFCQSCPKKFTGQTQLKEHELVHTEERNACSICCKTFEQETDLTKHMEIHNQLVTESGLREKILSKENSVKEKLFSSVVCNRKFRHNNHLEQHMKSHQREENTMKKPYVCENKCDFCCQSFKLKTDLTKHMEIHKEETDTDYDKDLRCRLCKKVYANKGSLKVHMKSHTGQKPYSCQVCSMKFGHKHTLKRHHVKSHKGECLFFCQICPEQFTDKIELKKHELVHAEKKTQIRVYTCETCKRRFGSNIHLQIHMLEHKKEEVHTCTEEKITKKTLLDTHVKSHIDKSHTCEICEATFKNKSHSVTHLNTHIEKRQPFSCDVCENKCDFCRQSFKLKTDLTKHMDIHKEPVETKDLWCRLCKKVYANKYSLRVHMRFHTGQKPFSCQVCSMKFGQKNQLKRHHMRSHKGECLFFCHICPEQFTDKIELKKHELVHAEKKTQIRVYTCETCKRRFGSNIHLQIHMLEHKKEEAHTCTEEKITKKKRYSCDVCKKHFAFRSSLNYHKFTHTGRSRYSCDVCGKQFGQKGYLNIHMRIHTRENLYSCDVCQKQFLLKSNFKSHLFLHADTIGLPADIIDKCFCCEMCGKYFRDKKRFISHINEHMGVRPYICDTCSKRFTNKKALKIHKQIHTREKSYSCDTCNRRFSMKASLKAHMIIHTGLKPFSCEICKRQFSFKSAWRVHMKTIHSGEKSHVCNICQKEFALLSRLRRHALLHTGKKPYPCHICAKAFIHKYLLNKHLLSHKINS